MQKKQNKTDEENIIIYIHIYKTIRKSKRKELKYISIFEIYLNYI